MSEMSEQPEALRLADELEKWTMDDFDAAAAELRRLHAENAELREANETFGRRQVWWNDRMFALEQQRDALRAELKEATEAINDPAVNNLRTLPESIRMLWTQSDALLEALRALVQNEGLDPYSYLDKGIGTATAAGQRWLNARAAIKAVEEGK